MKSIINRGPLVIYKIEDEQIAEKFQLITKNAYKINVH